MTESADQPVTLEGTGTRFDLALESLLRAAIDVIATQPTDELADQSVRFRAEAPTREELVRACLESIMAQTSNFAACPLGLTLDGVRPLEVGYRAWGSLFLAQEPDDVRLRLSIDASPMITIGPGQCTISVGATVVREL